jgi:hypothetical protein
MTKVNHRNRPWRRPLVPVLALAVALVVAPLPAMAGESNAPATASPSITAAAQKAVAAELKAGSPSLARAQSTTGAKADLGSPSFFKSPAGIITLIAVGAGLGFALYSTSHDRIKSPNVEYGNGGR